MYVKRPVLVSRGRCCCNSICSTQDETCCGGGRTSLSGIGDALKSIGGGLWGIVAAGEQAKGAQQTLQMQQQMAMLQAQQGIFGGGMGTLLLLGGAGLGVYLLLRKKKPAST